MATFRKGQRVRITQEGIITALPLDSWLTVTVDDGSVRYAHTSELEVLAEPRPDEPTGLGAVVEAGWRPEDGFDRRLWVRHDAGNPWVSADMMFGVQWHALLDPVILHDGYRAP